MRHISIGSQIYTPTKVICVGKNYDAHIAEMGGRDRPQHPAIFIKPNSAISCGEQEIRVPASLGLLHHEVELCFVVGKRCKDVSVEEATSYISGYAVGLDLTLRDMQAEAKKFGGPWALAKGFDRSAVMGEFVSADAVEDARALDISLTVNGEIRQQSNTREMIFTPAEILSYVSRFMTIEPGDIFMTGTPEGVGPLDDRDKAKACVARLPAIDVAIKR